jgi:hypothetical protein
MKTLKMEAARSSESLVSYFNIAGHHNPENHSLKIIYIFLKFRYLETETLTYLH